MDDVTVQIYPIQSVSAHPAADNLEICRIKNNQFVVPKDKFTTGDFVVPIAQRKIIQPVINLDMFDFLFKLYGTQKESYPEFIYEGKTRIKIKQRKFNGVTSDGILWPVKTTITKRKTVAFVVETVRDSEIFNHLDCQRFVFYFKAGKPGKLRLGPDAADKQRILLDFMNITPTNPTLSYILIELPSPKLMFDLSSLPDLFMSMDLCW